jgi:DNA-binding NtrC family response regulator
MPRKVDVRLVAATHRDLGTLAREGKFRQDLYYRLKVCTVMLPPLRARGGDVELLAEEFLEVERRELGRPLLRFAPEARRRLAAHSWPGNVRELQHVVRAAAALAGDGPIRAELLDLEAGGGELPVGDYHRDVYEFRRALVRRALEASGGNRAAAARQLGISRQAVSQLARELGLDDD